MNLDGGKTKRQITDFVQNNSMLTCGNLENINQIFLALTKLPKLMHHGHQDS